jgi:hypothetical protein
LKTCLSTAWKTRPAPSFKENLACPYGDIAEWREEIPWMSLYFSVAVWTSLALAGFGLSKQRLPHYRVTPPNAKPAAQPAALPVRSS